MKQFSVILLISFCFLNSCKKDKTEENTATNQNSCSTSMQELTIDGVDFSILSDTAYFNGQSFYTLHKVNDSVGCSFNFGTNSVPTSGKYNITPSFIEVNSTNNKVFVESYINGNAFQAQSGIVTISGTGSTAIIEVCRVKFKNSFDIEHQVSLKSDLQ